MRQAGETGNSLKMVFRNHPENERIVRTTAAVFVSILDPTLEEISDFKTAVSEAVTNAIIHAYPESGGCLLYTSTHGSVDIILDKSQRVDFFYHNTKENEIEGAACDIKGLPKRPPKTTRIRIEVRFTSSVEGVILLKDMGFGEMFPATGKITVFPFKLIS